MASNGLSGELGRFAVVGSTTVLIDLVWYLVLLFLGIPRPAAKSVSFAAGTVYAYFANRAWTFRSHGSPWRFTGFVALYVTTLVVNVVVNQAVLGLLTDDGISLGLAFLAATGTSATLNFLGLKFLVFSKRAPERA
jgi:putative flippase GtrA